MSRPQPPRRLVGYPALVHWLLSKGIAITEPAARRLPGRLKITVGRCRGVAAFGSGALRKFVLKLSHYPYEEWLYHWEASDQRHPLIRRAPRWTLPVPRPEHLFTYITVDPAGHEQVIRAVDGRALIGTEPAALACWTEEQRACTEGLVRWSGGRVLMDDDWAYPYDETGCIETLVLPFVLNEKGRLAVPAVPGSLFGIDCETTMLVAGCAWPRWPEARTLVAKTHPECIWTSWTTRQALNRYTLSPEGVLRMRPDRTWTSDPPLTPWEPVVRVLPRTLMVVPTDRPAEIDRSVPARSDDPPRP